MWFYVGCVLSISDTHNNTVQWTAEPAGFRAGHTHNQKKQVLSVQCVLYQTINRALTQYRLPPVFQQKPFEGLSTHAQKYDFKLYEFFFA